MDVFTGSRDLILLFGLALVQFDYFVAEARHTLSRMGCGGGLFQTYSERVRSTFGTETERT